MKITIGCIDGNTYVSDEISEEEVQKFIDENDGIIGTGALDDIVVKTPAEFAEFMSKMINNTLDEFNTTVISLTINGHSRDFKPETIVWHEIEVN